MAKKNRGEYEITPSDLGSTEMVFLVLSVLESLGYPGFMQLLTVINDPGVIIKIIRLMYGTEIKVPPLKVFIDALDTVTYMFSDFFKEVQKGTPAQPKFIRQHMNIDETREKELLAIFDNWSEYMFKHGVNPLSYLNIQRNNTKKRIKLAGNGKRWTAKNY